MAIQHGTPFKFAVAQQCLKSSQKIASRALDLYWCQTTNPHLEAIVFHRKNPSIAMGNPARAEEKTDAVEPTGRNSIICLYEPLHTNALQQRIKRRWRRHRRFSQQTTRCTCGVNDPFHRSVLTTAVTVLKKNMGTIAVERLNPNSAATDDLRPGSARTGPHR